MPRLPIERRSSVEALLSLPIATPSGPQPLARFVDVIPATRDGIRIRKDLRPVIYVTGDVAGAVESPVYAILAMNKKLDRIRINGARIARYNASQPDRLTEMDALVAYLQVLGTMVDVNAPAAQEVLKQERGR